MLGDHTEDKKMKLKKSIGQSCGQNKASQYGWVRETRTLLMSYI